MSLAFENCKVNVERRHEMLMYMLSDEGRTCGIAYSFGEEELLDPDVNCLEAEDGSGSTDDSISPTASSISLDTP